VALSKLIFLGAVFALSVAIQPVQADRGVYNFADGRAIDSAAAHPLWAEMYARHAREAAELHGCLADETTCPRFLRGYRKLINSAARLEPRRQLVVVNRFFNRRRYVADRDHPEVGGGQWHTISHFLEAGGDCEDFAIAKYFALRQLGFPSEKLRVVIAYDIRGRAYHALLAVDLDGKSHLLENDNTIKRGSRQRAYDVSYAINENYWWDHVSPGGNSRLAKSL